MSCKDGGTPGSRGGLDRHSWLRTTPSPAGKGQGQLRARSCPRAGLPWEGSKGSPRPQRGLRQAQVPGSRAQTPPAIRAIPHQVQVPPGTQLSSFPPGVYSGSIISQNFFLPLIFFPRCSCKATSRKGRMDLPGRLICLQHLGCLKLESTQHGELMLF